MDIGNGGKGRRAVPPVQFTSMPAREVAGPQRIGRPSVALLQPSMSLALNEIILRV